VNETFGPPASQEWEARLHESAEAKAPKKRRRIWPFVLAGVLLIGGLVAVTFVFSGSGNDKAAAVTTTAKPTPPTKPTVYGQLIAVANTCNALRSSTDDALAVDGDTMTIDTKGEDDYDGNSNSQLACVISRLHTPPSITERMDHTRALDGMQDGQWIDSQGRVYTATWNYHPDNGFFLTIEERVP
jgi:hypothetical protein